MNDYHYSVWTLSLSTAATELKAGHEVSQVVKPALWYYHLISEFGKRVATFFQYGMILSFTIHGCIVYTGAGVWIASASSQILALVWIMKKLARVFDIRVSSISAVSNAPFTL